MAKEMKKKRGRPRKIEMVDPMPNGNGKKKMKRKYTRRAALKNGSSIAHAAFTVAEALEPLPRDQQQRVLNAMQSLLVEE